MPMDERARALLDALNELFAVDWTVTPGSVFYAYTLRLDVAGRLPFVYHRAIKPEHVNGEPFAQRWCLPMRCASGMGDIYC